MDANGIIKIGPAGPKFNYIVNNWDLRSNQISQILISYGNNIDAIQFQFVKDGHLVLSELHGSNTGANNFIPVTINHPSEYIIELSGHWICRVRNSAITSLTIVTNLQTYGPIGNADVTKLFQGDYQKFRFQTGKDCRFGGFHGTVTPEQGLISIGLYLQLPSLTLDRQKDSLQVVKKEEAL